MNPPFPRNAAVRLAAAVVAVVLCAVLAAGWAARSRFADSLYREKVHAAESTLELVAAASVLPMAAEDGLTLNSLVKGAALGDGYSFVSVSDAGGIVRADTDFSRVGSPWKNEGRRGLELSRPILFQGKPVGIARLGLSQERLRADAMRDSFPAAWILLAAILSAALAGGVGFTAARSARVSRGGGGTPEAVTGNKPGFPDAAADGAEVEPGMVRNTVTVLCASVKGFRSYADETLPDDLMRNLKEIFSIASRNVLGYGGYIEKYQGESLTGVFGAPADLADHTRRAIRAAVSIQKSLQETTENGNELLRKVSIGISTGVVLSGQVPSGEKNSPFYVGEIFEEAASLGRAAREGEIVISRDVYHSVENVVAVEPLPPLGPGGGRGSWEAFRLLRIEERRNRA